MLEKYNGKLLVQPMHGGRKRIARIVIYVQELRDFRVDAFEWKSGG